jgi:hypothetical protein
VSPQSSGRTAQVSKEEFQLKSQYPPGVGLRLPWPSRRLPRRPSAQAAGGAARPVVRPPTNAGASSRRITPQPPACRRRTEDVLPRPSAARAAAPAGPTLLVKGFRITGNTGVRRRGAAGARAAVRRPGLGTEQLLDAAEQIKNRYKDEGYFLTQVFIPPQEVPDGIVSLRVVEAHVGQTRAEVRDHPRQADLVERLHGLLPAGAPVTEQNVERPLLLLNDLPASTSTPCCVRRRVQPGRPPGQGVDEGNRSAATRTSTTRATRRRASCASEPTDRQRPPRLSARDWSLGGLITEENGVNMVRAGVTAPHRPLRHEATLSARS